MSEESHVTQSSQKNVPTCSWWSPWLEAAKLKSSEVLEFVKNDLSEISTVVKSEATSVINSTTSVIKDTFKLEEADSTANTIKRNVSSFFGSVSNALNPLPEDDDQEVMTIKNEIPVKLSPIQVKIHELIKNPDTFLLEIEEFLLPQYNSWLGILDDQIETEKLTKQLVASPALHQQYESLVPEKISHLTFWKRFLFRKALLEDEESRKEIKKKKEKEQIDKVQWDKEDFAQTIELSEEEQIRILSEYENEKRKTTSSDDKLKKHTKEIMETTSEETNTNIKKDLLTVSEIISSEISSSSGDTEGNNTADDWEKDFELEDTEIEALTQHK